MTQAPSQGSQTGIEVTTGFFPLAFILFLCTPRVVVDGTVYMRPWGAAFFALPPGPHTIRVFFKYLFMNECGANTITVNVQPGQVTRVKYNMPPWMFARGSLKQV